MIPDPKVFQKRPRRVMSPDGKCFMNLWFIPHYTEIINAYRSMDYEVSSKNLYTLEKSLFECICSTVSVHEDILIYPVKILFIFSYFSFVFCLHLFNRRFIYFLMFLFFLYFLL